VHPRLREGSDSIAEYFRGGVLSSRVHLIKVHPSWSASKTDSASVSIGRDLFVFWAGP